MIERKKDYSILSFDGIGPIPTEEETVEVLPGQHRLIAYHRYGSECDGGARGSGNAIIGLAAIAIGAAGCYATSDNTHCAVLDFVGEAGQRYEIAAGSGDSVVLTDLDDGAVVARGDRLYQEDSGETAFLRSCSSMGPRTPPLP